MVDGWDGLEGPLAPAAGGQASGQREIAGMEGRKLLRRGQVLKNKDPILDVQLVMRARGCRSGAPLGLAAETQQVDPDEQSKDSTGGGPIRWQQGRQQPRPPSKLAVRAAAGGCHGPGAAPSPAGGDGDNKQNGMQDPEPVGRGHGRSVCPGNLRKHGPTMALTKQQPSPLPAGRAAPLKGLLLHGRVNR